MDIVNGLHATAKQDWLTGHVCVSECDPPAAAELLLLKGARGP